MATVRAIHENLNEQITQEDLGQHVCSKGMMIVCFMFSGLQVRPYRPSLWS
jgi:hypothetical protein